MTLGLLLTGGGGCGAPAPPPPPPPPGASGGSRAILDDAGVRTVLDRPVRRVVSLSPSSTELIFALGAGDRLVGRTTWCDFPAAALEVPSVGDGLEPNVELILSTRPDLVVLYRSPRNTQAAGQLRQLGVAAIEVRLDRLDDLRRAALQLGVALDLDERARLLVERFDRELEAARRPSGVEPRSLLALAWDHPPIVIGSGSFLGELIEAAGARNVFGDLAVPSAPVSIEAIVERNPDLVLVTADSVSLASRPEWQAVTAVRLGRFLRVSGSAFARPTPRAPEAVRQLGRSLDSVGAR